MRPQFASREHVLYSVSEVEPFDGAPSGAFEELEVESPAT